MRRWRWRRLRWLQLERCRGGLGPRPEQAPTRRVSDDPGSAFNRDCVLSLSQTSRAEALQPFQPSREQITAWAQERSAPLADLAHMSWPILAEHLARCFAPSLDMPPLPAQPVILVPSRLAPVTFDDLTQRLRWPLMDFGGAWIALNLDHDDEGRGLGASRIAALEAALSDGGNKPPFAIVAIARPEGGRMTPEPIALSGETRTSLDFPQKIPQQADVVSRIMAGLRRTVSQLAPPPPADVSVRQTPTLLQAGVDALIGFAEAGLNGSAPERLLAPLAKTYQLASLAPLAQLFARIIAGHEGTQLQRPWLLRGDSSRCRALPAAFRSGSAVRSLRHRSRRGDP